MRFKESSNESKYNESFIVTTSVSDAFTSATGIILSVPKAVFPIAATVRKSNTKVGMTNLFLNIPASMQTACQKIKILIYKNL